MKIGDVKLGSLISIKIDIVREVYIIGNHQGQTSRYVLLGWKGNNSYGTCGWRLSINQNQLTNIDAINNINTFIYGWWAHMGEECTIISGPIEHPNQICSVCKKPAPHVEPNQVDNKFLCMSCMLENDLI